MDILQIISREMDRQRFNISDIARNLNIAYPTAHGMMHRKTLQVQRLIELSEALQYNFFREIAATLPYERPQYTDDTALLEKKENEERIKKLEIEVDILRQTIKDMVQAR